MELGNIQGLSQNKQAKNGAQGAFTTQTEPQQKEFVSSNASLASRAYASAQISRSKNVNFEGKYEKITQTIQTCTSPSKVHLSFDEVTHLLDHLGYSLKAGKGSHYTVDIPNQRPLTIVKPHGDHKYVDPETVKDLKMLLNKNGSC